VDDVPAFGQADLTNCEREPIHLAGSVQPHGALLLLAEGSLRVLQASANTAAVLGMPAADMLGQPLTRMGGNVASRVMEALQTLGRDPMPLAMRLGSAHQQRALNGALHRPPGGGLVLELELHDSPTLVRTPLEGEQGAATLADAVRRITSAASIQTLADTLVKLARELTGYDRIMVYRFDADEHGQVIAEACEPRLPPFLGHHYPASDIPAQARALYLKNRVRMLVDVDAMPQAISPVLRPDNGQPLDMSLCQLRSMSPMHLQYLRNMGVTASMSASLVRDGRLWGLLAAHHGSPRQLSAQARAALELLSEVASTRIAAIENYAHAQVALLVRRLEQRLIEATSTEGDWRLALLRNPRALLQPLGATGAALFHEDEILTAGEAPSTPELRDLLHWVDEQPTTAGETAFAHSAVGQVNPLLATLTPTACGVLAVKLSNSRPDYLMWFRKEQLLTVTWAGDPAKPMIGDDPMQLSPRRSFQAWSEIVRGTAPPWALSDRMMARAIGAALVDIIVQVHAVRLLIAEHQLGQIRRTVGAAAEPVLLTRPDGQLIFANDAFEALRGDAPGRGASHTPAGTPVASLFTDPALVQRVLDELSHQPWRGEWAVAPHDRSAAPRQVSVRAERVPGRDGVVMGCMMALTDLSDLRRTAQARRHLEESLTRFGGGIDPDKQTDQVVGAILTNASIAAMDIADGASGPTVAPLLEELEGSARRATTLYAQLLRIRDEPAR
jgi:light-regulated signal transduction histidine kinase (bacteriophytochrome)